MRTVYSYTSPRDALVITNAPAGCRECIAGCDTHNEITSCQIFREKRRRGIVKKGREKAYICTNEAIKSSRLFKEKRRVVLELLPIIDDARQDVKERMASSTNRLIHNLISLNAQSIQSIYSHIPQDKFTQSNRHDLLRVVERFISKDTAKTAKLIVDLLKNEKLQQTEFSSYGKLFENEPINLRSYSIHKIVLLILNSFWNDLNKRDVRVSIGKCHEKVIIDYDILAATLVYILDNASKYILPGSTLNISFIHSDGTVRILFDMVSIKVNSTEKASIFKEGYSGSNPKKINKDGNGLGLSLATRLLRLIGGELAIEIDCDESRRVSRMGIEFENNIFTLSLPHSSN